MNPTDKRLAIKVTNHQIKYINFKGIIPEGHYGAGAIAIWNQGTYKFFEKSSDEFGFSLKR